MSVQYHETVLWDTTLCSIESVEDTAETRKVGIADLVQKCIKVTTGAPAATPHRFMGAARVYNSFDSTQYTNTGTIALPVWSLIESTSTGVDQVAIQFENQVGAHLGAAGTANEFEITGGGVIGTRVGDKIFYTLPGGNGGGGSAYDVGNASNFAILSGTSLTLSAFTAPSIIATGNTGETTMAGVAGLYGSGADTVAAAPYAAAISNIAALKVTMLALPGIAITTPATLETNNLSALGAGVFAPGVYTTSSSIGMTASRTITLSGAGDYVFVSTGGSFTFGANDNIVLTNGATAARVFWVAALDLATTGSTSSLVGNFIVRDATVASTNTIQGRILASRAVVVDGTATSFTLPSGGTGSGLAIPLSNILVGELGGTAVAKPIADISKFGGKITWSGGTATLITTVAGVLATDRVLVTVEKKATEAGYVASVTPGSNTITIVLSTANTTNDAIIAYEVFRPATS